MADWELCAPRTGDYEWSQHGSRRLRESLRMADDWDAKVYRMLQDQWDMPTPLTDVCDITPAFRAEFNELVSRWRSETAHVSSIPDLIMHPIYQKILRMPTSEVLPLILRELRDRGGFWFPALHAITDENPVDPKYIGNVTKMTEAWLDWGRKNGWILGA